MLQGIRQESLQEKCKRNRNKTGKRVCNERRKEQLKKVYKNGASGQAGKYECKVPRN